MEVLDEVTTQLMAAYEADDLIAICASCRRGEIHGEWVLAPRAALSVVDARFTLSSTLCPDCVRVRPQPAALLW